MTFLKIIIAEAKRGNWSFPIFLAAVVQIVIMIFK